MTIVGIDLGTTNSAAAIWDGNEAQLIPNKLENLLTPSVVGLDQHEDIAVGQISKDRLITHPDKSIANFKRWIGTSKEIHLGKNTLRPEELSAFVLKSLFEDVKNYTDKPIEQLVISVPAYFSDTQRKATLAAAKLSGLPTCRLINEPTAAALSYGLNEKNDGQYIVLDLGGGTFDVSILDKFDGIMEIKACAGDNFLGGEDFTQCLMKSLSQEHQIEPSSLNSREKAILYKFADNLKCKLSSSHSVDYDFELNQKSISGTYTREHFEEIIDHLIPRLRAPVERALRDSRISPKDINQIILVGGATRMPFIRKLAGRLFANFPLSSLDPDHIVAKGAAVQAALLSQNSGIDDIVMTDVCPHTLGTSVINSSSRQNEMVISPIIERNASIPISRVERYFTAYHQQQQIQIDVYQGEQLKPEDNIKIGDLSVPVPPGPPGKEAVDVRFTYDINGNLEVEVTVLSTNKKAVKYFQEGTGQLSEQEIVERFKKLQNIKVIPQEQIKNRTLIAWSERLYAEGNGEIKDLIREARSQFINNIDNQQNKTPEKDRSEFSQFLTDIEISMFGYLKTDQEKDND